MAEFRQVHCKTWRDDWFSELDVEAKLLWLYLITNQATSVSGIYQLPRKFISLETGIPVERIDQIMTEFKAAGKIDFDGSVIWVCKMREYQANDSPKVASRIARDIDTIPDCRVKGIYAKKYGMDTVSIPYFESLVDTDTDTDTETETDRDTETARKGAAKSRPTKKSRPLHPAPLQVEAYRSITHRYPHKSLYDDIVTAVPESDLDFYKQVLKAWIGLGWNPGNITGQLEAYKRREIPTKNGRNVNGHKSPAYTEDDYKLAERINATRGT